MTISLTCACGLLLEVDDKFAGQQISCPDCHYCLEVPLPSPPLSPPLSRLALGSLLLALSTAFTILGPLLAAALGATALWQLHHADPPRSGQKLAWAGLLLGVGFAVMGLMLLLSPSWLGGERLEYAILWTQLVELENEAGQNLSLEVKRQGFTLTRPSPEWRIRKLRSRTPAASSDQGNDPGVLLVNRQKGLFVACIPVTVRGTNTLDDCLERAKELFPRLDLTSASGPGQQTHRPRTVTWLSDKILPDKGEVESAELLAVKKSWLHARKFLLRILHKRSDNCMYLLVAGSQASEFAGQESELQQVLDSFRLLDRDRPEW